MLYWKVKPECDNKRRADGSVLVANELYTTKEKEKFHISENALVPVEISKRCIYFFFGARFEGDKT